MLPTELFNTPTPCKIHLSDLCGLSNTSFPSHFQTFLLRWNRPALSARYTRKLLVRCDIWSFVWRLFVCWMSERDFDDSFPVIPFSILTLFAITMSNLTLTKGVIPEKCGVYPAGHRYSATDLKGTHSKTFLFNSSISNWPISLLPYIFTQAAMWVWATLVDFAIFANELFIRRLSATEKEEFYRHHRDTCRVWGLNPDDVPLTYGDFMQYCVGVWFRMWISFYSFEFIVFQIL